MSPPRVGAGGPDRAWVSWRLLREVVLRLHHGYEAVPRAARRRWWWSIAVGAALVQGLALALVAGARWAERTGALRWEQEVLHWFESLTLVSFNSALWLEGFANGFVLWLVMLYAAGVAAWRRLPLRALSILVGYTLVYAPIATGWLAWDRERPRMIAGGLTDPGGFFRSFPSGHMVQGMFAHGILIYFWIRAARRTSERAAAVLLWLTLAAVVVVARLRIGSHWPTDVMAGAVLGTAWLAAVIVALRSALPWSAEPLPAEPRDRATPGAPAASKPGEPDPPVRTG